MFHSAECQIQCPITQQIKAKGPPPLPLWLIIEENATVCNTQIEMGPSQKKGNRRMYMHANACTHTQKRDRYSRRRGWVTEVGSLKPSLSISDRVSLLHQAHTEASQCWSQTTMKNRRSEHQQNVKINQVKVLVSRAKFSPHFFDWKMQKTLTSP